MLYSKYGPYKSVLALLQKGETPDNRKKLHESLLELWKQVKEEVEVREKAIAAKPKPAEPAPKLPGVTKAYAPHDVNGAKDDTHRKLINTANRIYAEMAVYHARLLPCDTDEKRLALAKTILDTEQKWIAATTQRDEYARTGKLTRKRRKQKAKDDITPNDLRRLMTTRTALSNYKNHRLPKSQDKFDADPSIRNKTNLNRTLAAIEKYEKQIAELENNG